MSRVFPIRRERFTKGIFLTGLEGSSWLTGCVKMADCIRVPLLLLFISILSFLHHTRGENIGIAKVGGNAENLQNPAGGPGPAAVNPGAADRSLGAGASPPRKRSTGWKLAEEGVCRDDLTRLCPRQSWNNNLAVLECLQDKKEVTVPDKLPWFPGKEAGCACLLNHPASVSCRS